MTGLSVALHLVIVSTVILKCREEQRSHFCDVGAFIFSVWQATKTIKIFTYQDICQFSPTDCAICLQDFASFLLDFNDWKILERWVVGSPPPLHQICTLETFLSVIKVRPLCDSAWRCLRTPCLVTSSTSTPTWRCPSGWGSASPIRTSR